ncbi:hypothetical protein TTHERM_00440550 (macronuclear) [Tetrahymena thermophila SB210]|uniref:Uncharacterized protein n=1 Tax=Tetrahymena thermophila (strain SB210) TaxID=312017 RepID=I7LVB4_TETTS|nr:hypothetical protein TTHERM_00440550 [Tetrahymena thermophila SB210]EAR97605.2 hypothetical protein TTHERM_00440550 [Tetrahymena thermophila SB210]|eukprot:XP_001017850.2 hypothetical protein TTHERM_00440550 [Tetrahymena thermophila SB210]
MVEGFYKSNILQKMNQIALFQAGNENEDRGEEYFGSNVEEEVQVIGNSLLRLVLECFMFWPLMFESDQYQKRNSISQIFDDLNTKNVHFPENINYFKSFYKQLNLEQQNQGSTIQTQASNSKQLSQEAVQQITEGDNKQNQGQSNNNSPKKKKKKEVNLKALEQKLDEENQKMEKNIQRLGKLLLVPTYLQLNKQEVKEIVDNLQTCSSLANTIFQVLEEVQDLINVELLTQYIALNEKTDEILVDYQQLISSNMKFDDFSIKYGITPTSSNEIKLLSQQDLQLVQQKFSDYQDNENKNQQLQDQQQELLIVEDLDFNGDSPAYKKSNLATNNQKNLSQPQIIESAKHSKQSHSVRQSFDVPKKQDAQQQQNKNNYNENYQDFEVPSLQQKQPSNSNKEEQQNKSKSLIQLQKTDENKSQDLANKIQNSNVQTQNQQKAQQQVSDALIQNEQQMTKITNQSSSKMEQQHKMQAPPNSLHRSHNNSQQKQNTDNDYEYDYEDEDDVYEEEDENKRAGSVKKESEVNKNQKEQQINQEQELKNNQQQKNMSQNIPQTIQRVSKVENSDPIIDKNIIQQESKKQSKIEDSQNNILKEKKNQIQTNKQQGQGSQHSIYNNEDDLIKNIQTLNTEQSQGFTNENKQKKVNQDQMKLSYNSRQSLHNNSMSGSQYDRGRSSSFKQLFEDPVHIQIMQQNLKRTSIPRGPTKDDQNNLSVNEQNRQSGFMSEKEKKEIQNLKERLQVLSKQLIEKDQAMSFKDQEIKQLKEQIQNMDKQNTERMTKIENQSTQIHYQLQLMNDEVSARDSVLEQNQKQMIVLQQKYDQLHHSHQELQLRCRDYESEIEEKNQELKYLKLQDQNNNENLLEDDSIQQLKMQINQLRLTINQKEQEINNFKNKLEESQEQHEIALEQAEQNNQELENQIGVLKQEVQTLRNSPQQINLQRQQSQDKIQVIEELKNAKEIISSQESIMKQKESTIQDLIFKNGQLKEKLVQLEQEINENKASYKKNLKQLQEENEQAKQILDPVQKENAEMFELLNLANMELDQLKQKLQFYEGQEMSYKQEKSTTRDQMEKLSMENVRFSCELQQQKEFLTQQQQQIKDLTFIIQQLKNDNFVMSQQVKSGNSLMHSNDKLFLNLPEGDNNSSQKFGQVVSSHRSNAPIAEKQNKQNSKINNQQSKKAHCETFGQQQLQEMNMGIQNTEEQEVQYLLDAEKMKEFLDQNQNNPQQKLDQQENIHQNQQQLESLTQIQVACAQNQQDQDSQSYKQLKKNDSDQNLTSIKDREESTQKNANRDYVLENQNSNNQSSSKSKLAVSEKQKNQKRNEKQMENLTDYKRDNNIYGQYDSVQKSSSKKQNLQHSSDISQFYSYQGKIDEHGTPKAPSVKPSFVREIQSPRRRSIKLSQYQSNSKNLGYMSFNQEEFDKNNQQNEELNSNRQDINRIELIPEVTSTIQSGQNTIYYSNNNTIEQAENINLNTQNVEANHLNQLKATPIKENFQKQKRLDKLQSLSDYLKTQSKKKGFSPMNTGPQAIKFSYNQTAEFEITMNNESKMNTLQQDLNTLDNQYQTEKIKLEDYQDENDYENESESERNNLNHIDQSPQNIQLIQYAEDDNISQHSIPIKIQQDDQNEFAMDQNQLVVQRTQMEDFSSKVSNYEDTQQNEMNRQSQLYYQQLIYPHQPDQYYIQKSMESSKIKSGLTIAYEEDFFNNLKILSNENLNRFKKSCLSDKSLLFENEHIKIGVTNHNHVFSGKNFVKLQIYIFNKDLLNNIPSFNLKYLMNEDISVWTKPEKLSGEIKINKHLKQDLIVDLNCIPFEFLTAHFQLEVETNEGKRELNEYFVMLPTSLNRFISFSLINANNFKSKWLVNQINSIKTEEFEYNTKIIKSPFVFLSYFLNTVELNPHMKEEHLAGLQDYKIGGIFQFYHMDNQQFLIKLVIKPFNKLQIHLSPSNGQSFSVDSSKCCHYLLQTLYFLFKYNPLDGITSDQNVE